MLTTAPSSARSPPANLTSLSDIISSLAAVEHEDASVTSSLAAILSAKDPMQSALADLHSLQSHYDTLRLDALPLSDKVSATAQTAQRVGNRVRSLDEEMSRVKEASEVVGQVMELKTTLRDLQVSIESQDWETAARLCARAMALPTGIISGRFAEIAVATAESPLPPSQTLLNAREQLRDIFIEHFKTAAQNRDSAATSRFFKLLPPIGWEEAGLHAYSSFVIDLIQSKPPPSSKTSSPHYYVTALTALFESICNIVNQHRPVVEKYYGENKMQIVFAGLQAECDRLVKRITGGWEEERAMARKLVQVSASAETGSGRKPTALEDETADPREMDKSLTEISEMVKRYTAYRRFICSTFQSDEDLEERPGLSHKINDSQENLLSLIDNSGCAKAFAHILEVYYVPLESWYLRFTLNQAFRVSTVDSTQSPPTSSVPDLAFYLLRLVLRRILDTGSLEAVKEMLRLVLGVMDREYAAVFKKKLDDVYRNSSAPSAPARIEKPEKEKKLSFIILLNDLDVSSLHTERLVKDSLSGPVIEQNFAEDEAADVKQSVSILLALVPKFSSTVKGGLDQLFNQLIRPRLRTFVPELYKDVSYVLDDDGYAVAENRDTVRKRFIKAWEGLVNDYINVFTERNHRIFFDLLVDSIVRPWEKFVLNLKFTELGAVRFDRDIRAIFSFLSSQNAFMDIRTKLQRLQQMSTVLNIDKEEDLDDFFSSSGINWSLTVEEAHAIVAQRLS